MKFIEVTYADLSDITHKIFVSEYPRRVTPRFKIIRFTGVYRPGGAGRDDALYIVAACEAAHEAWYSQHANILDFTALDYQWGDEMEWVFRFGWYQSLKYQHPLAIVVGDRCRKALQSLMKTRYDDYCRNSLPAAIRLAKQKHLSFEEHRKITWGHGSSDVFLTD